MHEIISEQSTLNQNVRVIRRVTEEKGVQTGVQKKRVAAYCRVSTDLEVQESSLALQMESFQKVIESHPGWELAGIFADEGLTGTMSENRPEFQRMMESARQGRIDVILVKSVSRFARNTADSLKYTRELTQMGVGVYFEKEGIDTSCFASEFLLTIFAAFAQEESHSISENIKRGLRNRYKIGEVPWYTVYGYRKGWVIEESEAEVIKRVFKLYAQGETLDRIAETLNEEKIPTPRNGIRWDKGVLAEMLKNEKYIGDALLQKTYVQNFVTHKRVDNKNADIEQYYKSNNHTPIIDRELFNQVQRILTMQSSAKGAVLFPYYDFLRCPYCGKPMVKVWIAGTIRQSAWTCGGQGPEELLAKRTNCPTYLLQERLMERTLRKAVLNLDNAEERNRSCCNAISEAQNEAKEKEKLSYRHLRELVESITLEGMETMVIHWKMGWKGKYSLDYTRAAEAVMPDIQIRGDGASGIAAFPLRNKRAFLEGFAKRQETVRKYRVIETECGAPIVLRSDESRCR